MQLITLKIIPPTVFPILSAAKRERYTYRLGISFCPSIDLVATYPVLTRKAADSSKTLPQATSDSEDDEAKHIENGTDTYAYAEDDDEGITIDIWRFNGQRVFTIAIDGSDGGKVDVSGIEWRNDGQIIAVLSSDNTLRLVNTFSGKVIHRFSTLPTYAAPASPTSPKTRRTTSKETKPSKPKPTVISYTTHFSKPKSTQSLLHVATAERDVVLDDLLSLNADIVSLLKSSADLPRELANIDVESFLPRLSCLPPVGFGGDDVFSSRASIDAVFHTSKRNIQSGTVDVLTTAHNDGVLSIRIFDSFELGGVDLNSAVGLRRTTRIGKVLKVSGWSFLSKVFILAEDTTKTHLHLFSLDLKFITNSSNTLPILATKATQLQNLLRYLDQIQAQLAREVKTAFDLPARYLTNVNEDLEKQDGIGSTFTTAAYHAIVTGEVSGVFKEWLSDQVGERGIKRWEKSVGDCLELIRRLVSEAWCPAVERAGVVVSRLSGLSGRPSQRDTEGTGVGVDRKLIEDLRETIDSMAICGEECLRDVIKEINGFGSFIKWLKWEVEASALEDTSERLDEMREGSDHSDITKVLDYIEQGPYRSLLKDYLTSPASSATSEKEERLSPRASFRGKQRRDQASSHRVPFDQLLDKMHRQCDNLFEQIARNLQQSIMTEYIAQLNTNVDKAVMDMRVIPRFTPRGETEIVEIHVLGGKKGDRAIITHQVVNIDRHQSPAKSPDSRELSLLDAEGIMDVKFVDDEFFIVLVHSEEGVKLYSRCISGGDSDDWEQRHHFKDGIMESGMKPCRMEVNGRKKRRVVGVLDAESKGYVVLDLDSGDAQPEHNGDDADASMTG